MTVWDLWASCLGPSQKSICDTKYHKQCSASCLFSKLIIYTWVFDKLNKINNSPENPFLSRLSSWRDVQYNILVKLELNLMKSMEHLVSVSYFASLWSKYNLWEGENLQNIIWMYSPYDSDNCLCIKLMAYTHAHGLWKYIASWPLRLTIIMGVPCVD